MKTYIFSTEPVAVEECEECGKPLDENHQTRTVTECCDCGCSIDVELCAEDHADICCESCMDKFIEKRKE